MGGIASKVNDDAGDLKNPLEISVGELEGFGKDPRSPTPDISRTPLQGQEALANHKITKNVDLAKECFEKYCNGVPLSPAVRAALGEFDPRSPTLDFQRTPLAVLIKNPELMAVYNRMNDSNFLNASNVSDLSEKDVEKVAKNLEEDLKNLSMEGGKCGEPLTIDIREEIKLEVDDRGSVVGLLETNLDYVETDLDTVKRKKRLPKNPIIKDLSEKDPRSPLVDRTPIIVPESNVTSKTPIESKIEIKEIFSHNAALQRKIDECTPKSNGDSLLIYDDNLPERITPAIAKDANKLSGGNTPRTPLGSLGNVVIDNPNAYNSNSNGNGKHRPKSKIPIKVMTPRYLAVRNSLTPRKPHATTKKGHHGRRVAAEMTENTPPKARQARWSQDNSVVL